ncbi:E3 ubiquitin-protein ligase UHRF1-like isoform X2 [Corticium candelabrum]|uniref:E3 ubiquitin-protein ligase UHRF1-like isoform X2 n=1 Tax=Corticium candelabrum TaxID=121492 RepID=UPI002E25D782|nr:E3 ubiquitin-protein ligase UHRF1-like isoform X2 [Corticium candelabrum]
MHEYQGRGSRTVYPRLSDFLWAVDIEKRVGNVTRWIREASFLQMEDGLTLFDYEVGLNDIIQLLVKSEASAEEQSENCEDRVNDLKERRNSDDVHAPSYNIRPSSKSSKAISNSSSATASEADEDQVSGAYKVGDLVDARNLHTGAWFEAIIEKVTKGTSETNGDASNIEAIMYHVRYDSPHGGDEAILRQHDVRHRAQYRLQWAQLAVGQNVMANYNPDNPKERGYWYDVELTRKEDDEYRELYCRLLLSGGDSSASEECQLMFIDEIFRIEPQPGDTDDKLNDAVLDKRKHVPSCSRCKDKPTKKCIHCACCVCGDKSEPDQQVLCDECDQAYHLWCLDPPLIDVPETEEWFCPECRNDDSLVVAAGQTLRHSKKRAKMVSSTTNCKRDWGRGMACVGRSKVCTIVPSNHFGAIPGVPVGTMWKYRVTCSESGVHRPHVAGIHGKEREGAYSIVLAGGYEDDTDMGEDFTYTGSGGRDLSGNRRTAAQSSDQKLTRMNKALAMNCDAPIDDKSGAEAQNWKDGMPVRVVRSYKGRKNSKYAPEDGIRYDGLYKVVKYWPEQGQAGFLVWRYLLRRDDSSPAPWTAEGKRILKKLGLTMQYPDGFLAAKGEKNEKENGVDVIVSDEESEMGAKTRKGSRKKKRKFIECADEKKSPAKKQALELTDKQRALLMADTKNKKLWEQLLKKSQVGLLDSIKEQFMCICCQELVYQPVTTECNHNVCQDCLIRSFRAEVFRCPACRYFLGRKYEMTVNKDLDVALKSIFPGYGVGR